MSNTLSVRVIELSSQHPSGQLGLPAGPVRLSWKVSAPAGTTQLGYELRATEDPEFLGASALVEARGPASQWIEAPITPRKSREVLHFQVRIETELGWSDWSEPLLHEVGLLNEADFKGSAIGDSSKAGDPSALLRRAFFLDELPVKARIYATAHGVFDVLLNQKKVGDSILAPGWTSYHERLLVETHDALPLLQLGENAFGVLLSDGWWRGKFGFQNLYNNYGEETAFLGQLELTFADGRKEIIATGPDWKTHSSGVRFASIYDGTTIDYTLAPAGWCRPGFDDSKWVSASTKAFDKSILEPASLPPVTVKLELPMEVNELDGRTLLNAKQNISGWVRLEVEGKRGDTVTIRHGEVLEPNNVLHTAGLRHAKATDHYTLGADGVFKLEPKHTFHGFQFAEVITDAKILSATAIAITSDNPDRSHFSSSHDSLNKLHSNVLWSLRDNFVSIPTDCPQRDERLGWTGDAQTFIFAATTLVNADAFFSSWLKDLAIEQKKVGFVPMVVPDLLTMQAKIAPSPFPVQGEAGWGDAAIVVPWALYQAYGNEEVLREQLESMRTWLDYLDTQREGKLIPQRMQLGDWLDPDAPEGQPWAAKVSGQFVANAYIVYVSKLLAHIESLVGDEAHRLRYAQLAEEVALATWDELGELAATTPTGAAMLLMFGIAPEQYVQSVADGLAVQVRDSGGRIATGFLGTPIILDALSRFGHLDEAYLMLLRSEMPSWLYPISVGATTIWERWNAIDPDGSIYEGVLETKVEGASDGMNSFNHYAYGAVIDWVYRNVAGVSQLTPGFSRFEVSPKLIDSIDRVNAHIETGFGRIDASFFFNDAKLTLKLEVPFGTTAVLDLPVTASSLVTIDGNDAVNRSELGHGIYEVVMTNPSFISRKN
jgi:alpha-L-rhamnosidase